MPKTATKESLKPMKYQLGTNKCASVEVNVHSYTIRKTAQFQFSCAKRKVLLNLNS